MGLYWHSVWVQSWNKKICLWVDSQNILLKDNLSSFAKVYHHLLANWKFCYGYELFVTISGKSLQRRLKPDFSTYKIGINCSRVVSHKFSNFHQIIAWNFWPLQPGTCHVSCLMYSLPVGQIGSNAIFDAIIPEIGSHGPIFRGAVTKELRHGSSYTGIQANESYMMIQVMI